MQHSHYDYNVPADQNSGTDAQRNLSAEPYLRWFPASRAAWQSTFRGRDSFGFHEFHIFQAAGISFLVLSLSWPISNAAIAWARGVIARNPTMPVILASHQLINIDSDAVSPLETRYGTMLWNTLIHDNDQIFMTLNGHNHGATYLPKVNDFGNTVHQMVVDYQGDYQGGNALMRLYESDLTNNKVDVLSFSPWIVQKPPATLNAFDRTGLTEPNQRFSLPLNFRKRFAGFMRFKPDASRLHPLIIPTVRSNVLAGFAEPPAPVLVLPRNTDDFPPVAGTAAHWRAPPGIANGQIVNLGDTLPDVFGGNSATRAPIIGSGQIADVQWTTDRHKLSSVACSLSFLNTNKHTNWLNAFLTAIDAAINAQRFLNGYTVETFIKIPADWSAANHAWGNMLGRQGNRGTIAGSQRDDPESSPVLLAISSLREVQWEIVPATQRRNAQTNWSGETIRGTWYHVAIVNDPASATTIMYFEGAPVLRNVGNAGSGMQPVGPALP